MPNSSRAGLIRIVLKVHTLLSLSKLMLLIANVSKLIQAAVGDLERFKIINNHQN